MKDFRPVMLIIIIMLFIYFYVFCNFYVTELFVSTLGNPSGVMMPSSPNNHCYHDHSYTHFKCPAVTADTEESLNISLCV